MGTILNDSVAVEYENIASIDAINCILGLKFPDDVKPFQAAFLTLAHLLASSRDYVLKRHEIPRQIVTTIKLLSDIIYNGRENQL